MIKWFKSQTDPNSSNFIMETQNASMMLDPHGVRFSHFRQKHVAQ